MNARPASRQFQPDRACPGEPVNRSLHRLRGEVDDSTRHGLDQLEDLLLECRATGVHQLHVEFDARAARVRLRQPEGLDTRRFDDASGLARALEHLHSPESAFKRGRSTLELRDGSCIDVSSTRVRARGGDSWQLTRHAATTGSDLLDDTVIERHTRERIVQTLQRERGLLVLVGDEPERLQPLANAMASRCTSPHRKVIRIESDRHPSLPGAVQVPLAEIEPDRQAATCRALLAHDADVIIADAMLPVGIGQLLDALAAYRLVIRVVRTDQGCDALAALRADGAEGPWLAEHLALVVRVDLLRRLCTECSHPAAFADPRILASCHSPARRLLAASLERVSDADGCPLCHYTGTGRTEHRTDALAMTDEIRTLLRQDAFDSARRSLERDRRTPDLALAMARSGHISPREAARLGAV